MHDKLNGFLDLAGQWAARYALASAPALIAKLDEDLDIGTPLPTKRVRNASTPTP